MKPTIDTRSLASGRPRLLPFVGLALAVAIAACVNSPVNGGMGDHFAPTVSLTPGTSTDWPRIVTVVPSGTPVGTLTVQTRE